MAIRPPAAGARLRVPLRPLRRAAHGLAGLLPVSDEKISLEYKLKRWIEGSFLHPDEAHFFWNGTFSPGQLAAIRPGTSGSGLRALASDLGIKGTGFAERYLRIDQSYYLVDDILTKTDRMSMAHSLEIRPPFLDHRIVEFAASLPESYKIRGFKQKFILKALMRGKLPEAVLTRKKTGFDIPTHDWFRGPLRALLTETVSAEAVKRTGIFDGSAVEKLIRDHLERRINAGYHLWGLLTFFLWMERWKVETGPAQELLRRESGIHATS
jgi:asparagine synthase (glutamine-hydrolysing)